MKKALNRHHLIPSSRGRDDSPENICHLPFGFHSQWHALFQNMTTEEAIEMIKEVMQPHKYWTPVAIKKLRNRIKGGEK